MDKMCCIDSNEILENTNFRNTFNNTTYFGEDNIYFNQGSSSELKTLPLSDMNYNPSKEPKIKINSLSRIPISQRNVIRKVSGDPFDKYKILKKLGNGTFGQVYKVMHKQTGNIRAMKIIPKDNLRPGFTDKDIIQEITIMKNLDHPHIIKLYEFYLDDDNYYLINEYCTEGDLSEKLYKLKALPEPIVKILMAQIFNAVLYLNNRGIIHGDLKLENILVDSYLESGENTTGSNNFISSLIQDAKDIKNYLSSFQLRRSSSGFPGKLKLNAGNLLKRKSEKFDEKEENDKNKLENKMENQRMSLQNNLLLFKNKKDNKKLNFNDKNEVENIEEKIEDENNSDEERKDDINNLFGNKEVKEEHVDFKEDNDSLGTPPNEEIDFENNTTSKKNKISLEQNIYSPMKVKKKIDFDSNGKNTLNKSYIKNNNEDKEYKQNNTESVVIRKSAINYNKLKIKNFELKLIDFGCSKIFSQYNRTFEDTIGTLVYCSPEVLKNNYNQKCDMWSCGVIIYILLCGKYPFYGRSEEEITKKILTGNFNFDDKHFDNVSESAKDLIRKCLIHDKNKRITIKEALRHEFFAGEININNIFEEHVDTKKVLNGLKHNSKKKSKFYQVVLTYLSYNFADKEELKRLRKIFYKIDLNLDGKISKEELFLAYKEAGMNLSREELEKIIKSIDFDGNGSIEYEEFIRVALPKEQLFTDINLKNAFDMFDLDKNGSISMSEILEVIGTDKEIDSHVIDELKSEILIDGDEEIDFKHFKEFMLELKSV